jgi:hypothetical protein
MIRIPIEFLYGVSGTGYLILHDVTREAISITYTDGTPVPDSAPYSYKCLEGEEVIDPILTIPTPEPSPEQLPQDPVFTQRTRLQFRNLFTNDEKLAIYTAAKSNLQIQIWLDDLAVSDVIDLADPVTIYGVQTMEAVGLIGSGRAAEILGQ